MTYEALVARLRAALILLDYGDITPAGRRVLERILDEAELTRPRTTVLDD